MKTSEEMAKSALEKIQQHQMQTIQRHRRIKQVLVPAVCVCFVLGGITLLNHENSSPTSEGFYGGIVNENDKKILCFDNKPIDEDSIIFSGQLGNFGVDIRDTQLAYDSCLEVALIHIDRVNGFENYSSIHQAYIKTHTVGKATIKKSYKGVLSEGTMIDFYRMGGKIPFDEYYKARPKREQARLDQIEEKPEYVLDYYFGHTEVEEGKDYLAYIVKDTDIHNQGAYAIDFYDTGFREIKQNEDGEILVLNNYTKEWEKLSEVIPSK